MPSSFDDPLPWPPGTRPRTIIFYAEDDGAPTIDLPPLVYCPRKSPTRRIEPQAGVAIHRRVEIVNQLLQLARKRIVESSKPDGAHVTTVHALYCPECCPVHGAPLFNGGNFA